MKIVVDTREQLPYSFDGYEVLVAKLDVGDYSVRGLENYVAVERKELNDLIGSITTGRVRLERELYRMRSLDYGALVVEASMEDVISGRYRSSMAPNAAIQSVVAFSIRYGLPVWFAGDRKHGQHITMSLLTKFVAEVQRRGNAIS